MKSPSLRKIITCPKGESALESRLTWFQTTSLTLHAFMKKVGFEFTLKDEQDFHKRERREGVSRGSK